MHEGGMSVSAIMGESPIVGLLLKISFIAYAFTVFLTTDSAENPRGTRNKNRMIQSMFSGTDHGWKP